MTNRSGDDLFDRRFTPSEPARIVFCRKIADECRHAHALGTQTRERVFQQRSFAGARSGDEADHEHTRVVKTFAQRTREQIVLLQHVLPDFNETRVTHVITSSTSSSSSATTSNSRPSTSSMTSCDPSSAVPWHAISYEKVSASLTTPDSEPSLRCSTVTRAPPRRSTSSLAISIMLKAIESSCMLNLPRATRDDIERTLHLVPDLERAAHDGDKVNFVITLFE